MGILETSHDVKSLKQLDNKQLESLCAEIRAEIVKTITENGGHLSANLGVVELTVALCKVFDFPADKIIFDVGHQCYAYKLLTDRYDSFSSIRTGGGISGFPDANESVYDCGFAGHAGTSIAAGLGYCRARDQKNEDYYVITLTGDASLFNGENFEAVSFQDKKPKKFLVVLNDNRMSIGLNGNGLYKAISNFTTKKFYKKTNAFLSRTIGRCFIGRALKRFKSGLKRTLSVNTIVDKLGLKYVGVYDGHDVDELVKILLRIRESGEPALLHVSTVKGKGYSPAETDCTAYHGVSANLSASGNDFSNAVSGILERALKTYPALTAITAGMRDGTGLKNFAEAHAQNFIDTGIAEELAVTYAAGIAAGGGTPVVFIYSTFLQRAYDQIINDVCLQNLPVVFCVDRAGAVGADGKTHQGAFDLSYLSSAPGITVFCPKNVSEFERCLLTALKLKKPAAIRYPNGKVPLCVAEIVEKTPEIQNIEPAEKERENIENAEGVENSVYGGSGESLLPLDDLNWEILHGDENCEHAIFACGPRMINVALKAAEKTDAAVINARVIKPLDEKTLEKFACAKIITLEENSVCGGFGSSVLRFYADFASDKKTAMAKVKIMGFADGFISGDSVENQLEKNGLTVENVVAAARNLR